MSTNPDQHLSVAHMNKEMDALFAKDIARAGFTEEQQAQISSDDRTNNHISEELEKLEETLDAIARESLDTNIRNSSQGLKPEIEDGEELFRRDAVNNKCEGNREMLLVENNEIDAVESEVGDTQDAYMPEISPSLDQCMSSRSASMAEKEDQPTNQDGLAGALNNLFMSVSTMIKSDLLGTSKQLELLEKMNLRVTEEYERFGDVASGLRVFVEQLKCKSRSFDDYINQIEVIEKHVTEFEALVSVLDKHVSLLESKMLSLNQNPLK